MIQGRFGENGQIYFDIDLFDANSLSLSVEAMLDTGFTEFMAMNQQDIESLEWVFLSQDKLMTAQGEEIQEILLGSQWLKRFILVANYQQRRVTLERN